MNASHILDALGTIDDKYIMEAKERSFMSKTKKARSMKRTLALVAVIAALLTLCGFAAYQLGWFDPWLQKPSADPVQTIMWSTTIQRPLWTTARRSSIST